MVKVDADNNIIITLAIDDCWNKTGVQGRGDRSCTELDSIIHCRNCEKFVAAGRQLLDRESTDEYKADWHAQISKTSCSDKLQSIVIFRLGDQWFGLPPKHFNEVIKWRGIHSIPHNRLDEIKGLIAIQGELHVCVSIGHILGVNRGASPGVSVKDGIYERMIVLSGFDEKYVFPVSEIRDIHHYAASELCDPPATSLVGSRNAVMGVVSWNDKHVSCLDFNVLCELIDGAFV